MKDCLQSTQQEVFKCFHNFGIILGFKALRLCSLMIAYTPAVNQSKALLHSPTFPLPAAGPTPSVVSLQLWLQGKPLLLAQPPGTNCCFPRLNYLWTLRTDPNHFSLAKALAGVEAREREGWGGGIQDILRHWQSKLLGESYPGWLAALVRFPEAVVL